MQCNLLSINIFLEDFSNDNVVVHVRFELTIFVTTISRRFLPPERDYHENRQKKVRFACGGTSLYIYCSASLLHRKNGNTELRACPEVGQTSVSATIVNNNYHIGVGQIFRSGPGGTITASTTATYTVGVTSNVSASITTGQIVKASISAGFSNSTSSSRSTSYKYSRSISPGRYGNMQYGNYGAQVNVKKPPLSLHAMSKCSLLEAQSCPVRTYGVTDIGKARPL